MLRAQARQNLGVRVVSGRVVEQQRRDGDCVGSQLASGLLLPAIVARSARRHEDVAEAGEKRVHDVAVRVVTEVRAGADEEVERKRSVESVPVK